MAAGTHLYLHIVGSGPLNCGWSGDGGFARYASLKGPYGVSVDRSSGNVFVSGTPSGSACLHLIDHTLAFSTFCDLPGAENTVRMVSGTSGIISTVVGHGPTVFSFFGDNGPATSGSVRNPLGLLALDSGSVLVAVRVHVIRVRSPLEDMHKPITVQFVC